MIPVSLWRARRAALGGPEALPPRTQVAAPAVLACVVRSSPRSRPGWPRPALSERSVARQPSAPAVPRPPEPGPADCTAEEAT